MIGIGGGISDTATGMAVPADNDNGKSLSGLACQGAYQQNCACAVTAHDKSSAAHGMLRASGKEIDKATPKFSSNRKLKAASHGACAQPASFLFTTKKYHKDMMLP